MPDQVIPITQLDKTGVVLDTPPVALPPNTFSDVRNVRFNDGAVRKIPGEVDLDASGIAASSTQGNLRYLAFWPNPNRAPLGGYYVYVIDQLDSTTGNIVGQRVFIQDETGTRRDVTPTNLTNGFTTINSQSDTTWHHTLFAGGFAFIINNGVEPPHYIIDQDGNQEIAVVPILAQLPGWQSYNVNEILLRDTFTDTSSRIFDTGQTREAGITQYVITVDGGTPLSEDTTTTNPTPETVTTGRYAVTRSNNQDAIIFATDALSVGNEVQINFQSVNAVNVSAGIIRAFGDFLVAGNLTERVQGSADVLASNVAVGATSVTLTDASNFPDEGRAVIGSDTFVWTGKSTNTLTGIPTSGEDSIETAAASGATVTIREDIVRRLPGVVRTSDVAQPGSIPNNWNPFAAGVSTADEFVIADTGIVQDLVSLQGNMYLYTNTSISVMRLTGNTATPLAVTPVTDQYGALTTNAVLEYDGKHFVIGSNDIYLFGGHPGSIQSVSDARTRDYFYTNINPIHERRLFTLLNQAVDEIWVCYPSLSSISGESTEALLWNYRDNTWSIRDLNEVEGGAVAPIPGGGIPGTSFTINTGAASGDSRQLNPGRQEIQTVTIPSSLEGSRPDGIPTIFSLAVQGDAPVAFDAGDIEQVDITFDSTMDGPGTLDEPPRGSGPNIREAVNTIDFTNITADGNDIIQVRNATDTGNVPLMYDTTVQSSGGVVTIRYSNTADSPNSSDAGISLNQIFDGVLTPPASVTRAALVSNLSRIINANEVPALTDWTTTANGNILTLTSDVPGARTFGSAAFTGFVGQSDPISGTNLNQTTDTIQRDGIDFTVDTITNTITATNRRTTLNDTVFDFTMSGSAQSSRTNQRLSITGGSGSGQVNDSLGSNNIVRGQARSGRSDGISERRLGGRIFRIPQGMSIRVNNNVYGPGTWLNAYLDQQGGAGPGGRLAGTDPVITFADASTLFGTNGANITIDATVLGSRSMRTVGTRIIEVPVPGCDSCPPTRVTVYTFGSGIVPGTSPPRSWSLDWNQSSSRGHYIQGGGQIGDYIIHSVFIDGVELITDTPMSSPSRTLERGESETLTFTADPTLNSYSGNVLRVAQMSIDQSATTNTVYSSATSNPASPGATALSFNNVGPFPNSGSGYLGSDLVSWTGKTTSISGTILSGSYLPGASIPLSDASAFPNSGSGTFNFMPNRFPCSRSFTWTGRNGNTLVNVQWCDPFGGSSISAGYVLSTSGQALTGVTGITQNWGSGSGIGMAVPLNFAGNVASNINVIETSVDGFALAVLGNSSSIAAGGTFAVTANTGYNISTSGIRSSYPIAMYRIRDGGEIRNGCNPGENSCDEGQPAPDGIRAATNFNYAVDRAPDAVIRCWTHSGADMSTPTIITSYTVGSLTFGGYGLRWDNGVDIFVATGGGNNAFSGFSNQGAERTGRLYSNTTGNVRVLVGTQHATEVAAHQARTYYLQNNGANDFTIDSTSTFYTPGGDNVIEAGTLSNQIQNIYKTTADFNARNTWRAVGSTAVISGRATDWPNTPAGRAAPVVASTTGGNGIYGISEADSPAIRFNASVGTAMASVVLEKDLTSAVAIRDDIYNKLRVISPFDGLDPTNAQNVQPANAEFYLSREGNALRLTYVTTGNPPDASEADFTWTTVDADGNTYGETQFGGFISDSVNVVSQGAGGNSPPVVRVSHARHGNADIILFGNNHTDETVTDTIGMTLSNTGVWNYDSTANRITATAAPIDDPDEIPQNALPTSTVLMDTDTLLPTNFALNPTSFREGVSGSTNAPTFSITDPSGASITHQITGTGTRTAMQVAVELEAVIMNTQWTHPVPTGADMVFTDTERRDRMQFTGTRVAYPFISTTATGNLWTVQMTDAGTSGTNTSGNAQFTLDPIPATITASGIAIKRATNSILTIEFGGLPPGQGIRMIPFGNNMGPVATPEEIAADIRASIQSDSVIGRRVTVTGEGRVINVRPNQFGEDSVYISAINESGFRAGTNGPAILPTDESIDPQPVGMEPNRDFGTPATLTYANLGITQNSITTTLDVERPWEATQYNPNRLYPIFAQTFSEIDDMGNTTLTNRLRAADIGYTFGGTAYTSYVERLTIGLTPEFDTEQLTSVALWADGGTPATIGGVPVQATLRLSVRGTNSPGEVTDLTVPDTDPTETNRKVINDYIIGEDYKIDVRIHGRFVNYRIDDSGTPNNVAWNLSGMQFDIMKGGRR